jgi:hypothetical protein
MISRTRARQIASDWYNGDASGLYAIASCNRPGELTLSDYELALDEIEACQREAGELDIPLARAEQRALGALGRWVYHQHKALRNERDGGKPW